MEPRRKAAIIFAKAAAGSNPAARLRARSEISEPDGAGILAGCKVRKGAHIQDM